MEFLRERVMGSFDIFSIGHHLHIGAFNIVYKNTQLSIFISYLIARINLASQCIAIFLIPPSSGVCSAPPTDQNDMQVWRKKMTFLCAKEFSG